MHNENFGYYISIIYRHIQIHLNKEFNEFGFGSGQYLHFIHISYNEGITQKELSQSMAIDKGTTAKAIHKSVEQGYIYSKIDRNDKRSSKLFLTKSGKNILPRVRLILNKTSEILKSGMDSSEKLNALSSLKKISNNIIEHI
jgi:DNA-binding MarR family transcriptional regulator